MDSGLLLEGAVRLVIRWEIQVEDFCERDLGSRRMERASSMRDVSSRKENVSCGESRRSDPGKQQQIFGW